MSRHESLRRFRGEKVSNELLHHKGIVTKATSWKGLAEEAPLSYKNVEEVVNSIHGSGISLKVVRVEPVGVCKG